MADIRHVGEAAARELLRRERSAEPLAHEAYELVAPDALMSERVVAIWADALQRSIRYGGDDVDALDARLNTFAPQWLAYDICLMIYGSLPGAICFLQSR